MAATRVLIIANPAAGTVTPALVWELVRVCRRQVRDVSVRWTTAPGEATRIARRAAESVPFAHRALAFPTTVSPQAGARTVVVAVGGDGTVREVAAGLASAWRGSSPTPLLIVPAGTSCYHRLFGDVPWQSTVESLLASPAVRYLDLARVAGRLVFTGASAGVAGSPYPGRVTVDGRVVHSGPTLLANIGCGDGLLDVRVHGGVHERGRRVTIERTDGQPLRFEHDGEVLPLGPAEYTIDVVPAAVPVLVTSSVAAVA